MPSVHLTYVEKGGSRYSWCGRRSPFHCTISASAVNCKSCIKAVNKGQPAEWIRKVVYPGENHGN